MLSTFSLIKAAIDSVGDTIDEAEAVVIIRALLGVPSTSETFVANDVPAACCLDSLPASHHLPRFACQTCGQIWRHVCAPADEGCSWIIEE